MRKSSKSLLVLGGAAAAVWYFAAEKRSSSGRHLVGADTGSDGLLDDLIASIRHTFSSHGGERGGGRPQVQRRASQMQQRGPFPRAYAYPGGSGGGSYGQQGMYGAQSQQGYGAQTPQYGDPSLAQPTYQSAPMPPLRQLSSSSPRRVPLQPTPHELAANDSSDRGPTPIARTGKFLSKTFGGPPSTPAGGFDDLLLRVQKGLNILALDGSVVLKEDGIYGPESTREIKRFQRTDPTLAPSGLADQRTYARLVDAIRTMRLAQQKVSDDQPTS
jgi:hypothetical protein